jgi:YgiT-type zinc finger domain-containing protein
MKLKIHLCDLCGGELQEKITSIMYQYQGNWYLFDNVKADVCEQCGEKYLPGKIARDIEKSFIEKKTWDTYIHVPKVDLAAEVK